MAWRFFSRGGHLLAYRVSAAESVVLRVEPCGGAEARYLIDGHAVSFAGGHWRSFCRCENSEGCWHVRCANEYRQLRECVRAQEEAADARDRAARSAPVVLAEAECDERDPVFEESPEEECP